MTSPVSTLHGHTNLLSGQVVPGSTSVGGASGCDIKGPGSVSICNLCNLLDVFKLLAVKLLRVGF